MKAWEEFYPDVTPEVPGCPDPTIDIALRRSAQRFFQDTGVWRLWLDDVTTTGGMELDIELEPNSELAQLLQATLDGREIEVYAPDHLPAGWKTGEAGFAVGVCSFDAKTLHLLPQQASGLVLRVEATLRPSNKATGVEDRLFDRYVLPIAMGAKALLMAQPGKAWSNPDLASAYANAFASEIHTVGAAALSGFSRAPRRVRPSFF